MILDITEAQECLRGSASMLVLLNLIPFNTELVCSVLKFLIQFYEKKTVYVINVLFTSDDFFILFISSINVI